jgi:toxin ParE1/3/4
VKVQFTPSARNQFLSALSYIRKDKPSAAVRFRQKAEKILRRLEEFPESGRFIPEFPELPHREVIVSPYRFFYKTKAEVVWIVAVWHGARIPNEPAAQQLDAEHPTVKSINVKSLPKV